MIARAKPQRLVTGERTKIVKRVKTAGGIAKVKATCLYRNQPVFSKKDRQRLCTFKVWIASDSRNARVKVTPHCGSNLKARVRIVMRDVPGEGRVSWKRIWKVKRDSGNVCDIGGNG